MKTLCLTQGLRWRIVFLLILTKSFADFVSLTACVQCLVWLPAEHKQYCSPSFGFPFLWSLNFASSPSSKLHFWSYSPIGLCLICFMAVTFADIRCIFKDKLKCKLSISAASSSTTVFTLTSICVQVPYVKVAPEDILKVQFPRFTTLDLRPTNTDISLAVAGLLTFFNSTTSCLICAQADCEYSFHTLKTKHTITRTCSEFSRATRSCICQQSANLLGLPPAIL